MNVISHKKLREFYETHTDSKSYLIVWFKTVRRASWKNFNELKADYHMADIIADNRVIFNIKGNHYLLIIRINFEHQRVMIKWVGTHADYDRIDAHTI